MSYTIPLSLSPVRDNWYHNISITGAGRSVRLYYFDHPRDLWSPTWLGFLWFCSHDHNNANPDIIKSSLRLIMPVMWPKTVCVPVNLPPLFRESLLKNTSNFFAFVPQCLFTCKDGTKMRASGIVGAGAYMFNLEFDWKLRVFLRISLEHWMRRVLRRFFDVFNNDDSYK